MIPYAALRGHAAAAARRGGTLASISWVAILVVGIAALVMIPLATIVVLGLTDGLHWMRLALGELFSSESLPAAEAGR